MDVAAAKRIAWFFLLGDRDENDAVPYRDSFSAADQQLVFRRFGTTPVSRWATAEKLYAAAGLDARFALYPGVAHETTRQMQNDVEGFFERNVGRAR